MEYVSEKKNHDDYLYGAKAIARHLGWFKEVKKLDENGKKIRVMEPDWRKVSYVMKRGVMPIWNEPGVGIMSRKSALAAYFLNKEKNLANGAEKTGCLPVNE